MMMMVLGSRPFYGNLQSRSYPELSDQQQQLRKGNNGGAGGQGGKAHPNGNGNSNGRHAKQPTVSR